MKDIEGNSFLKSYFEADVCVLLNIPSLFIKLS